MRDLGTLAVTASRRTPRVRPPFCDGGDSLLLPVSATGGGRNAPSLAGKAALVFKSPPPEKTKRQSIDCLFAGGE